MTPPQGQPHQAPAAADTEVAHLGAGLQPNPDQAWKQLSIVNDWIRHSDTKAGATLAMTSLLATITFNLLNQLETRSLVSDAVLTCAVLLLITSGILCSRTLTPRVRSSAPSPELPSRLYFGSIATNFTRDGFRTAFLEMTADPDVLVNDLADQIYVNSVIASTKTKCVRWAIRCTLLAIPIIAVFGVIVGGRS